MGKLHQKPPKTPKKGVKHEKPHFLFLLAVQTRLDVGSPSGVWGCLYPTKPASFALSCDKLPRNRKKRSKTTKKDQNRAKPQVSCTLLALGGHFWPAKKGSLSPPVPFEGGHLWPGRVTLLALGKGQKTPKDTKKHPKRYPIPDHTAGFDSLYGK